MCRRRGYKYQPVIRGKKREHLQGDTCSECERVGGMATVSEMRLESTHKLLPGHDRFIFPSSQQFYRAAGMSEADIKKNVQKFSRHRYVFNVKI
jgi:hypothetical protein